MLIANDFKHDPKLLSDCHTHLKPWETAMTAKVTIFGKNS